MLWPLMVRRPRGGGPWLLGSVQVVDPQTAVVLVASGRHTPERVLIDPRCYEGPGTAAVHPAQAAGTDGKAEAPGTGVAAGGVTAGGTSTPRWRRRPD